MAAPYFQNTAVADLDDLFDELQTQLLAAGWTEQILNSSSSPALQGRFARESIFIAPGTATQAAACCVGISRVFEGNGLRRGLQLQAFTNTADGLIAVTSISRTATTMTFTTTAPHGLSTGDLIRWNGSDQDDMHSGWNSESAAAAITVTGANTFTLVGLGSGTLSANGGFVRRVFNCADSYSTAVNSGMRINAFDSSMDIFGYRDEFRICGIVQQGGNNKIFYVGQSGRDHVQQDQQEVAIATTAITGIGVETVTLDRNISNWYVGMPIMGVQLDGAGTTGILYVTDLPAANQVEVDWGSFTGNANAVIIGFDPAPTCVSAPTGTTVDLAMNSMTIQYCLGSDGTRYGVAQNDTIDPLLDADWSTTGDAATEQRNDPMNTTLYVGEEYFMQSASSSSTTKGVRKFAPGFNPWPVGTQNEFDIQRVGGTPEDDDWKIFVSDQSIENHALGIGPGATN